MREKLRILQIIPADGWFARYRVDDGLERYRMDGGEIVENPLSCWALVDDSAGDRFVLGMDGTGGPVMFCEDSTNFVEYWHKDKEAGA